MIKVLIVGYGFIGRHLAEVLAKKDNISLTVLDRTDAGTKLEGVSYISGDFSDVDILREALNGQRVVYHFVSSTIPSTSWNSPLIEIEKNLRPSLQLIELAAEAKVEKIAFASSGGTIYGFQQGSLNEESRTEPYSPYGIIKRTIESFLEYARVKDGLNFDIYRISNVYGEGQNTEKGLGFINTTLESIVSGQPITIFGDGKNVRDYIYVRDAAKLLTLSTTKDLADSDIYNVSSNHQISLNNLIKLIKDITGISFHVEYFPARLSDNRRVNLNNSKIMTLFPEYVQCSLEDGIRKTYDYLKETNS